MSQPVATQAPVNLAIGVFDGVHRGHQYLLERMVAESVREVRPTVCLTFDPHPDGVLDPERSPGALSSVAERIERLGAAGLERVDVLPFTPEVAQQSAMEFVIWAHGSYRLHSLWAGSDFALGRDRTGTIAELEGIGATLGFEVRSVDPLRLEDRAISSTWIRECLKEGDVRQAAELMGRAYSIEGVVIAGARRGQQLGFRTANVVPPVGRALPADGVYLVDVQVSGASWHGVANLGSRPTFGEDQLLLETHIFDFNEDIYGANVAVAFLERLRGVQRFDSMDQLHAQIQQDVRRARELVASEWAGLSTGT